MVLFFFLQNSLFDLITRCSQFYHKFQCFFNDSEVHFLIHKIHLEKSNFFWSFPRPFYLDPARDLSYVCSDFNNKKSPQNLLLFINRVTRKSLVWGFFVFSKKKSACSPRAVNDFNKTYSTSAVPLLVRNVSYVCGAVARNS